jgi:predicted HicB family RNase H-like nuclease
MTKKRVYGHTSSGKEIDDEMASKMVEETESGYGVEYLLARRGRRDRPSPKIGESSVESFRIDDDLKSALASRAETEGVSVSELLRRAVREYLKAG